MYKISEQGFAGSFGGRERAKGSTPEKALTKADTNGMLEKSDVPKLTD